MSNKNLRKIGVETQVLTGVFYIDWFQCISYLIYTIISISNDTYRHNFEFTKAARIEGVLIVVQSSHVIYTNKLAHLRTFVLGTLPTTHVAFT